MEARLACPKCHRPLGDAANFCPACGEDLRGIFPQSDTLSGSAAGRVIDNRYRLKEKLGEGGMGAVFKAEHIKMGKVLALKLLRPDLAKTDKKLATRFHQEARVVSRLSHPNTVQVFDYGECEDGSLYLAMEFLPGRDLAWMLRTQGPLSEERAVFVAMQVLSSLAEAHEQNIVHRDIKPANVMLVKQRDGRDWVKVLDFGIAKLNENEGRKHITGVADFVGTPAYMSPEQARGEPLDARSDVYAVGAMLFELVTGRPVFDGPTPISIVTRALSDPPPRIHEASPGLVVSAGFEQVVRKALAKKPEERFASADAMRQVLERLRREAGHVLEDSGPVTDVTTQELVRREDFDRFERSLRVRRVVVPVLMLGLLGTAGVAGYRFLHDRSVASAATLGEEQEPNNDPGHTNRIALGAPVHGKMGAPLGEALSDRDLFEVDVPEPSLLSVSVSGLPEMNLVVDVLRLEEEGGALKAKSLVVLDDGGPGRGERVDGLRVEKGTVLVRVEERAHHTERARGPRESSHHAYTLEVRRMPQAGKPGAPQFELEPNDAPAKSMAVIPGRAVVGFAGEFVEPPVEDAGGNNRAVAAKTAWSSLDFYRFVSRQPGAANDVDPREEPAGIGAAQDEAAGLETDEAREPDDEAPSAPAAPPAQDGGTKRWVLVVPPERGALLVEDLQAKPKRVSLKAGKRMRSKVKTLLAPPVKVEGAPMLVAVEAPTGEANISVKPASGLTPAGARYHLAFVTEDEGGLQSVAELVRNLAAEGATARGIAALEAVRRHLPQTPQLSELEMLAPSTAAGRDTETER